MNNRLYKNDPYEIIARFDSLCPETGKQIKRADRAVHYPLSKTAVHIDSKSAKNYFDMRMDDILGGKG